jgi:RNA polymerase sigma-70 factor (ECF subfamily)
MSSFDGGGMDGSLDGGKVSRAYQEHRPYLVDLAFRMLGDIGAAEDAVQDAFSRLMRADIDELDDVRGWLVVVTSRLCLDQIRSARARRERAHDATEIEYVAPAAPGPDRGDLADPADRVTFDDSVRLALLAVLERLSPPERVVFVLHDVFRMPFDEIAQTVGRPVASCRQLARRARQKIVTGRDGVRFDIQSAEHRLATEKFIAACASGDLGGLLEVLAPDAWGAIDLGPDDPRSAGLVRGADRVARNLLRFWGPPATLVSHPVGGQPALLGFFDRKLAGVLVFGMTGELIQSIQVIGDPRKLGFLSAQLSEHTPAEGNRQ